MVENDIKDWTSLLEFIISNYPARVTEGKILEEMGISRGSYFAIKNKKTTPGTLLQRRILEYVKKKFNLDVEVVDNKVSVKNSNIAVKPNNDTMAGRDITDIKELLVNKLIEITRENERLKKEIDDLLLKLGK